MRNLTYRNVGLEVKGEKGEMYHQTVIGGEFMQYHPDFPAVRSQNAPHPLSYPLNFSNMLQECSCPAGLEHDQGVLLNEPLVTSPPVSLKIIDEQ